jgi:hypothetical protein
MEEERMEKKNRARGGVEQCLAYANIPTPCCSLITAWTFSLGIARGGR